MSVLESVFHGGYHVYFDTVCAYKGGLSTQNKCNRHVKDHSLTLNLHFPLKMGPEIRISGRITYFHSKIGSHSHFPIHTDRLSESVVLFVLLAVTNNTLSLTL